MSVMSQCLFTLCFVTILFNFVQFASSFDYFIDKQLNCDNVIAGVSTNSKYITHLGKKNNTNDCINACINLGPNCLSYTYYTSSYTNKQFTNECYARLGYILWIPQPSNNVNCGRIIYNCQSDTDCSLNGVCNHVTKNCTCNIGWKGYRCGVLDLLPANKSSGYNRINTTSWGGTVVIDDNDTNENTKYHMFVSEIANHCGMHNWMRGSQVVHTQSTNGYNSAFIRRDTLIQPFAHEPDIIRGPNGEYVIYYEHYNYKSPAICNCSDGNTSPDCHDQPSQTYFIQSMQYTLDINNGSWYEPMNIWNVMTSDTNFAAIILDNSSVIGMIRKWAHTNPDISQIYLVTANNWKDNSSYIIHDKNQSFQLFPYLETTGTEDPFMYIDCKGRYHSIFHNMDPNYDMRLCGGHAFSEDGIHWIYSGYAFGNTVEFTDGSIEAFDTRERPHFIFDENDKCTPIALTTGAQLLTTGDATYTLLQPIRH
eukprot:78042_1